MQDRNKILRRVLAVYETIDSMHELAARRAEGELHEVESAVERETQLKHSVDEEVRGALRVGDRLTRSLAEAMSHAAELKRLRLSSIRLERELSCIVARQGRAESHVRSERVRTLVDQAEQQVEEGVLRSSQAAVDDRFLSRRLLQRSTRGARR